MEMGSVWPEVEEGEGRGWRVAVKSLRIKIWASMCAVAYYPRKVVDQLVYTEYGWRPRDAPVTNGGST